VDLDEGTGTAEKDFGGSLYNASLAGARRSQKQKITDRAVRHSHSRQINLIHVDDSAYGSILPNDLAQQPAFKVEDFSTSHLGIESTSSEIYGFTIALYLVPVPSGPCQDSHRNQLP